MQLLIQLAAARASLQAETERKEAEAASEAAVRREAEAALEAAVRKVAEPIPEAVPEPDLEADSEVASPEVFLREDMEDAGVSAEDEEDVVQLAEAASAEGLNVFVTPRGGVPAGGAGTLYYDVAAGPLGPVSRFLFTSNSLSFSHNCLPMTPFSLLVLLPHDCFPFCLTACL